MLYRSKFIPIVFLLLAISCIPKVDKTKEGLIIHSQSKANDLNPVNCRDAFSNYLAMHFYQTLVDFDFKDESMVGLIAKSPPIKSIYQDSLLKFDYQIRPEACFNDGKKISAKDVLFSLKAHLCPGVNSSSTQFFRFILDLQIQSDDSLSFSLITNNLGSATKYFSGAFYILDARHFDPNGILEHYSLSEIKNAQTTDSLLEKFAQNFNGNFYSQNLNGISGTGPYQLIKWDKGQFIHLSKKENWWGEQVRENENSFFQIHATDIRYQIIEDQQTAFLALQAGEIDFSTLPAGQNIDQIDRKQYQVREISRNGYQLLGFRLDHPILKEQAVRKAISYCIPRKLILKKLFNSNGKLTDGPIDASRFQALVGNSEDYFNLEKAKIILEENAWQDSDQDGVLDKVINGKQVKLTLPYAYNAGNDARKSFGLILKQEAAKIGISISLEAYEWKTYVNKLRKGELPVFFSSVSTNSLFPDLSRSFHSNGIRSGRNLFAYQSQLSDSLITEMKYETDSTQKNKLFRSICKILQEDQPCVFLWSLDEIMIAKKSITPLYSKRRPYYWVPAFKKGN